MHERYAMLYLATAMLAGPIGLTNKPPMSDEDLAREREAQRASQQAYLERMEQRKHPATQSKPKSASLERMLGRTARRA